MRGQASVIGGITSLQNAGNGFLRHEILFASGSTLPFEFEDITVRRTSRCAPDPGQGRSGLAASLTEACPQCRAITRARKFEQREPKWSGPLQPAAGIPV